MTAPTAAEVIAQLMQSQQEANRRHEESMLLQRQALEEARTESRRREEDMERRHQESLTAMRTELARVASSKVSQAVPTNTESLLKAFSDTTKIWNTADRAPSESEVQFWEVAYEWYKTTGSIKDSFDKANAGETPDKDFEKLVTFAKLLRSKDRASTKPKDTPSVVCHRCFRTNHPTDRCRAKTTSDGIKLE